MNGDRLDGQECRALAGEVGVDRASTPTIHERGLTLDPRLSAIEALVGRCGVLADIGCDHGRLGARLLARGRCCRVQFADISPPSLEKARRLIGTLGLSSRADFCVGDGAQALSREPEVAVIAGMGGTTIARIVREGRRCLGRARLILQPNVAATELRRALCACGYRIYDERVARAGRRHYVVICAEPGEARYDEAELTVGPVLLRDRPEALRSYAAFRLRVADKALAGAERGDDPAQRDALRGESALWREVLECVRR